MVELADAADSKSAEGNLVGVRPPLPAPILTAQVEMPSVWKAFLLEVNLFGNAMHPGGVQFFVHIARATIRDLLRASRVNALWQGTSH